MFGRKKNTQPQKQPSTGEEILGKNVRYSKTTAEINPKMILREFDEVLSTQISILNNCFGEKIRKEFRYPGFDYYMLLCILRARNC